MGPKPIQDIAPPSLASGSPAEPRPEPELVSDVPVRTPAAQASDGQKSQEPIDDDSSFIVPEAPVPAANGKDKIKSKNSKPRPALAIAVAIAALICLAIGAYLKFNT